MSSEKLDDDDGDPDEDMLENEGPDERKLEDEGPDEGKLEDEGPEEEKLGDEVPPLVLGKLENGELISGVKP